MNISRREKLLGNPGYVAKAPEHLVKQEQDTLEKEKNEVELIKKRLNI